MMDTLCVSLGNDTDIHLDARQWKTVYAYARQQRLGIEQAIVEMLRNETMQPSEAAPLFPPASERLARCGE